METSASFEARYAPLPYPTNQVGTRISIPNEPVEDAWISGDLVEFAEWTDEHC
jgi:hypothetical protein